MTWIDPSELGHARPADVRARYEQAVQQLARTFADSRAIRAQGGDERTATAICTADGGLSELRISQSFASRVSTDQLSAAVRDAIRTAQDAVDTRVAELSGDSSPTPEELAAQLTELTREGTRRLQAIQQRAEELASRIRQYGTG